MIPFVFQLVLPPHIRDLPLEDIFVPLVIFEAITGVKMPCRSCQVSALQAILSFHLIGHCVHISFMYSTEYRSRDIDNINTPNLGI